MTLSPALHRPWKQQHRAALSLPGERMGYVLVPTDVQSHELVYAAIAGAGRSLGYVNAPSLFQRVCAACADETSRTCPGHPNPQPGTSSRLCAFARSANAVSSASRGIFTYPLIHTNVPKTWKLRSNITKLIRFTFSIC